MWLDSFVLEFSSFFFEILYFVFLTQCVIHTTEGILCEYRRDTNSNYRSSFFFRTVLSMCAVAFFKFCFSTFFLCFCFVIRFSRFPVQSNLTILSALRYLPCHPSSSVRLCAVHLELSCLLSFLLFLLFLFSHSFVGSLFLSRPLLI